MRWYVASIALFVVVALAGCGQKGSEKETANNVPRFKELKTEDTKVGTGPVAAKGDMVWMRYRGTFSNNGKEFDSNMGNEKPSYDVVLGAGSVIKGWDQGIPGMKEGGKRKILVPSDLAYGPGGRDGIPPNADLIFDVELIKVLKPEDMGTVYTKTLKPGTGKACKEGDTVTIEFEAKTLDGVEIDSSKKDGKPATFKIGNDELFAKGLDAGVEGMKVGEKRLIELMPPLGMPAGMGSVTRATVQSFTVELVKIK